MGDAKLKGIHLLTALEMNNEKIAARYQDTELFHIPFPKVHNTAIYNNSEIEIDIPFEDFNEQYV
jgi:hypothetical protein